MRLVDPHLGRRAHHVAEGKIDEAVLVGLVFQDVLAVRQRHGVGPRIETILAVPHGADGAEWKKLRFHAAEAQHLARVARLCWRRRGCLDLPPRHELDHPGDAANDEHQGNHGQGAAGKG